MWIKLTEMEVGKLMSKRGVPDTHNLVHCQKVRRHVQKAIEYSVEPVSEKRKAALILAALTHEVDDRKYFPLNQNNLQEMMLRVLNPMNEYKIGVLTDLCLMVGVTSFSENGNDHSGPFGKENQLYWVRYCDRLETLGKEGMVRLIEYQTKESSRPIVTEQTPRPQTEDEMWESVTQERMNSYMKDGTSASLLDLFFDKILHCCVPNPNETNPYILKIMEERTEDTIIFCLEISKKGEIPQECLNYFKRGERPPSLERNKGEKIQECQDSQQFDKDLDRNRTSSPQRKNKCRHGDQINYCARCWKVICPTCNEVFPNQKSLKGHKCPRNRRFACGSCNDVYLTRNAWEAHLEKCSAGTICSHGAIGNICLKCEARRTALSDTTFTVEDTKEKTPKKSFLSAQGEEATPPKDSKSKQDTFHSAVGTPIQEALKKIKRVKDKKEQKKSSLQDGAKHISLLTAQTEEVTRVAEANFLRNKYKTERAVIQQKVIWEQNPGRKQKCLYLYQDRRCPVKYSSEPKQLAHYIQVHQEAIQKQMSNPGIAFEQTDGVPVWGEVENFCPEVRQIEGLDDSLGKCPYYKRGQFDEMCEFTYRIKDEFLIHMLREHMELCKDFSNEDRAQMQELHDKVMCMNVAEASQDQKKTRSKSPKSSESTPKKGGKQTPKRILPPKDRPPSREDDQSGRDTPNGGPERHMMSWYLCAYYEEHPCCNYATGSQEYWETHMRETHFWIHEDFVRYRVTGVPKVRHDKDVQALQELLWNRSRSDDSSENISGRSTPSTIAGGTKGNTRSTPNPPPPDNRGGPKGKTKQNQAKDLTNISSILKQKRHHKNQTRHTPRGGGGGGGGDGNGGGGGRREPSDSSSSGSNGSNISIGMECPFRNMGCSQTWSTAALKSKWVINHIEDHKKEIKEEAERLAFMKLELRERGRDSRSHSRERGTESRGSNTSRGSTPRKKRKEPPPISAFSNSTVLEDGDPQFLAQNATLAKPGMSIADNLRLTQESNAFLFKKILQCIPEDKRVEKDLLSTQMETINERNMTALNNLKQADMVKTEFEENVVQVPTLEGHRQEILNLKEASLLEIFAPEKQVTPMARARELCRFLKKFFAFCNDKTLVEAACIKLLKDRVSKPVYDAIDTWQKLEEERNDKVITLKQLCKYLEVTYSSCLTPRIARKGLPDLKMESNETLTDFVSRLYDLVALASYSFPEVDRKMYVQDTSMHYFMNCIPRPDREMLLVHNRHRKSQGQLEMDMLDSLSYISAMKQERLLYREVDPKKGAWRTPRFGRDKVTKTIDAGKGTGKKNNSPKNSPGKFQKYVSTPIFENLMATKEKIQAQRGFQKDYQPVNRGARGDGLKRDLFRRQVRDNKPREWAPPRGGFNPRNNFNPRNGFAPRNDFPPRGNFQQKRLGIPTFEDAQVGPRQCLKCGVEGHYATSPDCVLREKPFSRFACTKCNSGCHYYHDCIKEVFTRPQPKRSFGKPKSNQGTNGSTRGGDKRVNKIGKIGKVSTSSSSVINAREMEELITAQLYN